MAYTVVNLLPIIPSSAASTATRPTGGLDDGSNMTLFLASSANANTSTAVIQVTQYDPADVYFVGSTAWYNLSTAVAVYASSGSSINISNISFKGLRLNMVCSSQNEIIAYVSKQIPV